MTERTRDFPWTELRTPTERGKYTAQLIASDINPNQREIYWARGWMGKPALLVYYACNSWFPISLPEFKNLLVQDHKDVLCLTIELLDVEMAELFLKVCLDLVAVLQGIDLISVRQACVLRLEHWASFLRPSRSRMTPESQKGLIAELHLLSNVFLNLFDEKSALQGWTGPDSGPRDFAYGQTFVEVKSKRSSANPCIVVSSEYQLSIEEEERLFIYVEELNSAPIEDKTSLSLNDVVADVKKSISSPLFLAVFDAKLAKVGYFDEDDYSDSRWTVGSCDYFEVVDDFPRIDSSLCPPGVKNVSYQIDLSYCLDYKADRSALIDALEQ